jgi:signal transduction histidine kinase/CheY-like chemotaxis protein
MIATFYSPVLVAISVLIACLASYTALDLAGRVTVSRARNRLTWLLYGSTAMGVGIWSMHFVGMLAFQMSVPVAYDVPLVLTSALIAVAAASIAMFTVSRENLPTPHLLVASPFLGLAIAGMHYTGMEAMQMPASLHFDASRVWLSIAIAVTASYVALWLAYRFRLDESLLGRWRRGMSALVMGAAIAGMHYTGMSAAHFTAAAAPLSSSTFIVLTGSWLTLGVIGGPALVLALALFGASADRHSQLAASEYERVSKLRDEMEATVLRRTAELRAALVAAEDANRAKSEFLAHMSHELRTPLNSVIGFADILRKNTAGNQSSQDLLFIERIGANARHLLTLINDVLDLAKIESGHMEVEITQVSLAFLIGDVIAQLEGSRMEHAVPVLLDVPARLAPISTDASKMRQILMNLIGNAHKFTQSGSITIRVCTDADDYTPRRIDVIDTGVGIPASRLDAVFAPFVQADSSTSRKYGGTGLGLPITVTMCRLLGASLSVTSTIGEGSTFSITLPDSPAAPISDVGPADTHADASPGVDTLDRHCSRDTLVAVLRRHSRSTPTRVLVVEDEADAQEVLLHHLKSEDNVETRVADSGITALQMLATFAPDLILLDVRMPKMDGIDFLKHLRNDPLYARIPVVVVTGEELTAAERQALMAQSMGIVGKGGGLEIAVHQALAAVERHLPIDIAASANAAP